MYYQLNHFEPMLHFISMLCVVLYSADIYSQQCKHQNRFPHCSVSIVDIELVNVGWLANAAEHEKSQK